MTDRELVELAAKAAGIRLHIVGDGEGGVGFYSEPEMLYWNPLVDDGDAFRLAVMLSIDLSFCHEAGGINDACQAIFVDAGGPWSSSVREEFSKPGPNPAATRRAIVRAAAGIGSR